MTPDGQIANPLDKAANREHHGVPTNQIYAWRSDARFQADGGEVGEFSPVELVDGDISDVPQ